MDETSYRQAEARLWGSVGIEPAETWIRPACTGTQVRVQEVGGGEPILFIHGGPNAGSTWAPLVGHLSGFRCLLIDRPGTGLSEPCRLDAATFPQFAEAFVGDLLDALEIDRADVVASSLGGHIALRSAAAHPERFKRMVQMAAPALVPDQRLPIFIRLLTVGPIRKLINALPPNERAERSILRQIGHGKSLDAGRIPQPFIDWYLDLDRYTDTMRNDGELIAELIPSRDRLTLTGELLGSVRVPTLFPWGEDDAFGGAENAREVTAAMPEAELVMLPEAGHLPWIDDPAGVGAATREFLRGA